MSFDYFVSYAGNRKDGTHICNSTISVDRRIQDDDTVREVERSLCERNDYDNAVLLNFVPLSYSEEATEA